MTEDPMFKQGAYPHQRGDGLYMDGVLVELAAIFARKIVDDNQFLGLCCSSTFGVRTGKSTLMQQFGKYYTYLINKTHGLDIPFDEKNIVFNTKDLERRAFQVKKHSCLILDEGEGLDEHVMSKTIKDLQKFLRRSGQLNILILVIMPDFFSVPKFLAMSRSNFLIDVKFEGEFERGFFEYYNFTDKKKLYVKGKKYSDYAVQNATLKNGRFVPMYCVSEEKYRQMKLDDLNKRDTEDSDEINITHQAWKRIVSECIGKVYPYLKTKYKINQDEIGKMFCLPPKTIANYYHYYKKDILKLGQGSEGKVSGWNTREVLPLTTPPNDTITLTMDDDGSGRQTTVEDEPEDIYSQNLSENDEQKQTKT